MNITTKKVNKQLSPLQLANGRTLLFNTPLVMGVINLTPDSFYDGGKFINVESAVKQAEKLISEGADIIDLGAASTRPGAEFVSPENEIQRILPVIIELIKAYPEIIISVDTFHAEVAKECIKNGTSIINDISAGMFDKNMMKTIAELNVPYILMHIQGTPQTMQIEPKYNDVVNEVYSFLAERLAMAKKAGIKQLIVDPGFSFGKTVEHNFLLLRNLSEFKNLGLPIMAGISRKSMINKVLKTKPENALTGTIALNTLALLQGADILRVHDVKEAKQVIKMVNQYLNPETEV